MFSVQGHQWELEIAASVVVSSSRDSSKHSGRLKNYYEVGEPLIDMICT